MTFTYWLQYKSIVTIYTFQVTAEEEKAAVSIQARYKGYKARQKLGLFQIFFTEKMMLVQLRI